MRWSGKYTDDTIMQVAAALVDNEFDKPTVHVAQEEQETKEELKDSAIEHAKTYWMLGWTWDEIGALLEDMEFPEASVKAALKEAQLYAVETLKNGPYGRYKFGQLVKMKDKSFAKVVGQNQDGLVLADLESGETYLATDDMVFEKRSGKLTEAFLLRSAAAKIRKVGADKDVELYDEDFTPNKVEEKTDFLMTPTLQKPKKDKWPHGTPEQFFDVEEASTELGEWVGLLDSLHSDSRDIQGKIKELRAKQTEEMSSLTEEFSTAKEAISESKDMIIGILSAEENVLEQMEEPVFKRFGDLLVGLHKNVETFQSELGEVDKFNLLMESIETVLPKTKAEKVLTYFDNMKKLNTLTTEILETKGVLYKGPKKTKGSKQQKVAGMWDKIKSWFQTAWGVVDKQSNEIIDDVIPAFEEASNLIEEFLSGVETKHANKRLAKMFG